MLGFISKNDSSYLEKEKIENVLLNNNEEIKINKNNDNLTKKETKRFKI